MCDNADGVGAHGLPSVLRPMGAVSRPIRVSGLSCPGGLRTMRPRAPVLSGWLPADKRLSARLGRASIPDSPQSELLRVVELRSTPCGHGGVRTRLAIRTHST